MIIRKKLRLGDAGVSDTIQIMSSFARKYSTDPQTKALIQKIGGADETQQLKNIFSYILTHISFVYDPENTELVKSPKWTLFGSQPYGDCDDLSTALASLLLAAGYKVMFKTIAWRPENPVDFSHVYLIVFINSIKSWVPMDPTKGDMSGFGWELANYKRSQIWSI